MSGAIVSTLAAMASGGDPRVLVGCAIGSFVGVIVLGVLREYGVIKRAPTIEDAIERYEQRHGGKR